MGRLAMPSLLAQAVAPRVGALLLERIGAHGTMAVVASVAALNVALTVVLGWMVVRHRIVFAKPRLEKLLITATVPSVFFPWQRSSKSVRLGFSTYRDSAGTGR
jgi:hypothetical protein